MKYHLSITAIRNVSVFQKVTSMTICVKSNKEPFFGHCHEKLIALRLATLSEKVINLLVTQ